MKRRLAGRRESSMGWLGRSPNHPIDDFLSRTKASSSRSKDGRWPQRPHRGGWGCGPRRRCEREGERGKIAARFMAEE